jgi:hypothetical protein
MNKALGVAALGVALVVGAGCGGAADSAAERLSEEAIEEAAGGEVDIEDGSAKVTNEDGSSFEVGTGDLPEGWPEDIPMPEGTEITSSAKGADGSDQSFTVTATTSLSPEEVDAHFADLGWDSESESSSEAGGETYLSRTLVSGDQRLSVGVSTASGETTFNLVLTTA